jgi:hypothetical protein
MEFDDCGSNWNWKVPIFWNHRSQTQPIQLMSEYSPRPAYTRPERFYILILVLGHLARV